MNYNVIQMKKKVIHFHLEYHLNGTWRMFNSRKSNILPCNLLDTWWNQKNGQTLVISKCKVFTLVPARIVWKHLTILTLLQIIRVTRHYQRHQLYSNCCRCPPLFETVFAHLVFLTAQRAFVSWGRDESLFCISAIATEWFARASSDKKRFNVLCE